MKRAQFIAAARAFHGDRYYYPEVAYRILFILCRGRLFWEKNAGTRVGAK
jgi:hypothetical protein